MEKMIYVFMTEGYYDYDDYYYSGEISSVYLGPKGLDSGEMRKKFFDYLKSTEEVRKSHKKKCRSERYPGKRGTMPMAIWNSYCKDNNLFFENDRPLSFEEFVVKNYDLELVDYVVVEE